MKRLILIRHAHRDTSKGRQLDNGLSSKGQKQRDKLSFYFIKHYGMEKPHLFSSPAKRCVQTSNVIAEKTKTKVHIIPGLLELNTNESSAAFKSRIRKTLGEILNCKGTLILICSHGDWIPMATQELCGANIELGKGGWIDFEVTDKKAVLKNVFQKF